MIPSISHQVKTSILPFEIPGGNSPLYKILDFYEKAGLKREESETLRRWIEKNKEKLGGTDFSVLIRLHEELRFDTNADRTAVFDELVKKYEEWMDSTAEKR